MSDDGFESAAEQSFPIEYVAAACTASLLYDYALTFDQEIERMWTARWSVPKFLFFANRYIVGPMWLFSSIVSSQNFLSVPFCTFYLNWLVCTIAVTNAAVNGILVMRIWAIYRTERVVLAMAVFFYIGGICTLVGLMIANYMGETEAAVNIFNSIPGCRSTSVPTLFAGFWIAPLVVESILFVLVGFRAFVWWKDKTRAPPTLVLIARDSTVYFGLIFALMMANLLYFEYGPPDLLMLKPSNTVVCIAGSRILLNLRGLAYPSHTTDVEIPTLRFSPPKDSRTEHDTAMGTVMSTYRDTIPEEG